MNKKLLAVLFALSISIQSAHAFSDGLANSMESFGKAAMKSGNYKDAAQWFRRGEIYVDSNKDPGRDGFFWEMIGYCSLKSGELDKAEEAFKAARVSYERAHGAMSTDAARVLDQWAAVYIERKDYDTAYRMFEEALDWSLGTWSHNYQDISKIPFRVARINYVHTLMGAASKAESEYSNAIYQLKKIEPNASTTSAKIDAAIKQLFVDWHTDIKAQPAVFSQAAYDKSWTSVYGTKISTSTIHSDTTTSNLPGLNPANPALYDFNHTFQNPFKTGTAPALDGMQKLPSPWQANGRDGSSPWTNPAAKPTTTSSPWLEYKPGTSGFQYPFKPLSIPSNMEEGLKKLNSK